MLQVVVENVTASDAYKKDFDRKASALKKVVCSACSVQSSGHSDSDLFLIFVLSSYLWYDKRCYSSSQSI